MPGGGTDADAGNDLCNATLGDGETLAGVAAAFGTDWMALYALNGRGGSGPDAQATGGLIRYGHEYRMRAGETLEGVAARLGTTAAALVDLNYNTITHVQNPARLGEGDVVCVLPGWRTAVVSGRVA